jgi:hypothetical protein
MVWGVMLVGDGDWCLVGFVGILCEVFWGFHVVYSAG